MNELIKTDTGELLPFISASLSSDVSSWVWSANFALPDLATLNKLKPTRALKGDYVEASFKLGLETFNLIIEEADSNDTGFSYAVTGRSKSILLAEPYSAQITKTWRATSAMAICTELCAEAGILMYWQAIDWDIDEFISDKRYPIDIIIELAGEVEALVSSLPNGTLVVSVYPVCSPNRLADHVPDFSIATDTNLFARSRKFVNHTNFNRVLITTESSSQLANKTTVAIEESIDELDRLINVFVTPFVESINIRHASGNNVVVWYEGIQEQTNSDQLVINDGKAQLTKPFHELLSVQWHQDVVGQLSIDKAGQVSTDLGLGLVTVVYTSRYHRYRVQNVGDVDLTLIAVDEIPTPTDISALSIELAIGDGQHIAPPIVVKTLSSLLALKSRGESFLWKQLYDADEYSIECAYQHVPMMTGKVALVGIRDEDLLFKGWIKSVSINVDTAITQQVTIERTLL